MFWKQNEKKNLFQFVAFKTLSPLADAQPASP